MPPIDDASKANEQQHPALTAMIGLAWGGLIYGAIMRIFEQISLANPAPKLFSPLSLDTLCLFKHFTHIPCFFCGLTRSFIQIIQGHFLSSLNYHPLGLPLFIAACLFAFIGPFYPTLPNWLLRQFLRKSVLIAASAMIVTCWLWKIGHSPRFW